MTLAQRIIEGYQAPATSSLSLGQSGWLNRSGVFFPLGGHNNHHRWSMWFQGKSVESLQDAGWLRVVPEGNILYVDGPSVSPSQSKALKIFHEESPDATVYHMHRASRRLKALFGPGQDLIVHQ